MRWPWRQRGGALRAQAGSQPHVLGLQTAKDILAEVFHARPADVEELIQRRGAGGV